MRQQQNPQQQPKAKKPRVINGITFDDRKTITPLFRIQFSNLVEKSGFMNNEPSYNFTMLFPHDTDFVNPVTKNPKKGKAISILRAMENAKIEFWGQDKNNWPAEDDMEITILDGDEKPNWAGFEGNWAIKAKSYNAIPVYGTTPDEQKGGFLKIDPRLVEDGDYCRAVIAASAFDYAGKIGVNFYCQSIQLVKKGKPFVDVGGGEEFDDGVYENEYEDASASMFENNQREPEPVNQEVFRKKTNGSQRPSQPPQQQSRGRRQPSLNDASIEDAFR